MPNQQQGTDSEVELKAGHPPAVKVGNMRITQRTHSTSSDKNEEDEQQQRKSSTSGGDSSTVPSACSFAPKTVVNKATGGVTDTVASQANTEAIKHIHEKPIQATHDYRGSSKPNIIHQPKK